MRRFIRSYHLTELISTSGRTQIAAGSTTVLGLAGLFEIRCLELKLTVATGPSMLVEQVTEELAAF